MKLIPWNIFSQEIEAYTVTKTFGDMSFNNPNNKLILDNRKGLASYLHTDLQHMVAPRQTHTSNFKEVSLLDGGTNMQKLNNYLNETDALYTKDANIYLLTFHADCTPILLYCRDQGIVSSIHSGWPGTTKQITSKVVNHLIDKEQCNPKQIYAYIGPSINKDNFEVREDVINLVRNMDFDTSPYYTKKDEEHYRLDNKGLNAQQLINAGVPKENITISPYCTINNNDLLFSHRKKESGRSITIIKKVSNNMK
jgi:conserved hypothetical protein TIGR00726